MKPEAQNLREKVTRLQEELTQSEKELDAMVRNCQHQYGETVYDPIIREAYSTTRIEGFGSHPPIPSVYVPREEQKRWKRECQLCGDVQYTTKAKPAGYKPVFPNTDRRL